MKVVVLNGLSALKYAGRSLLEDINMQEIDTVNNDNIGEAVVDEMKKMKDRETKESQKSKPMSDEERYTFVNNLLKPQRLENESFEDYKKRRANGNQYIKHMKYGRLFWNSEKHGTYRKGDVV